MWIQCYCILCKKHPFYETAKRKNIKPYVGSSNGWGPVGEEYKDHKCNVECFEPESGAEYELNIDLNELEFNSIWYSDGHSETCSYGNGYLIFAVCKNETEDE